MSKGVYQRWQKRQELREHYRKQSLPLYESQLEALFGKRQPNTTPNEGRQANIRVGGSYAVICQDNDQYYRVVFVKANPQTGGVQLLMANPVMGVPPEGIQVVEPEKLYQFQKNNQNLQGLNQAFPHWNNQKQSEYERWGAKPTAYDEQQANIDNTASIDEETKLDKVGSEDGDIDNDGDRDSTDQYLSNRRKAIGKAIAKDEEEDKETCEEGWAAPLKVAGKEVLKQVAAQLAADATEYAVKKGVQAGRNAGKKAETAAAKTLKGDKDTISTEEFNQLPFHEQRELLEGLPAWVAPAAIGAGVGAIGSKLLSKKEEDFLMTPDQVAELEKEKKSPLAKKVKGERKKGVQKEATTDIAAKRAELKAKTEQERKERELEQKAQQDTLTKSLSDMRAAQDARDAEYKETELAKEREAQLQQRIEKEVEQKVSAATNSKNEALPAWVAPAAVGAGVGVLATKAFSKKNEETGAEYHARMSKKVMPWEVPNTTRSNTTPEVEARVKKQQADARKAASDRQAAAKAKEASMSSSDKAKRDNERMAKAYASPRRGVGGGVRAD